MDAELAVLLAILAAFSVYNVLSGMELGVALMRMEPRLAPVLPSRRVFTPRWEFTNILLVIGAAGLTIRFNDAAVAIIEATLPVLVFGFLALLLRAGVLMYLFATRTRPGGQFPNYVFTLTSLVVPLSLGSAGIYMLTGEPFWRTLVGATLFASLVAGLLALAFGFVYYVGAHRAPQGVVAVSRVCNLVLAGMLALVLVGVLQSGGSHLLNLSYAYLAVIASSIVLLQAVWMAANREWRMWWCLAGLALLAPFLMCLANYPYLVYPDIMLSSQSSAETAFRLVAP